MAFGTKSGRGLNSPVLVLNYNCSTNAPFLNGARNRAAASQCRTPVPVLEVGRALQQAYVYSY